MKPNGMWTGLTGREKDIVKQLLNGSSDQEIALTLGMSEKMVRNRLSVIYEKLDVHNRTQAALYAVKEGIAAM